MNSKTIAVIAVFAALTIVLTIFSPIRIPAPYAPFLKYQIWEIPIVVAFLLFGPLVGVAITIINTIVLLVVYPGDLPTGPFYNLAAVLSMLFGMYIAQISEGLYKAVRGSATGLFNCSWNCVESGSHDSRELVFAALSISDWIQLTRSSLASDASTHRIIQFNHRIVHCSS